MGPPTPIGEALTLRLAIRRAESRLGERLAEQGLIENKRHPREASHAANGLGGNRVEQFGFCFSPCLVWWQMVALAISLVWL